MIKKIATIIFSALFFCLFCQPQLAGAAYQIGALEIDYLGAPSPLFSVNNIAPGYSETKTISILNSGKVAHSFSLAVDGQLGKLADALVIEPEVGGQIVWSKTISQIAKNPDSNIIIGSIAPSTTAVVNIRAYLPREVDNSYQGSTTLSFNFVVGSESTDQLEPTNYTPPVASSLGQRISQAIRDSFQVDNQGENSISAPPSSDSSNSLDKSDVKGVSTTAREFCFWWLIFTLILVISLIIYHRYLKQNDKILLWWLWPIIASIILYLLQLYFDKFYQPTIFCEYFWLLEIIVLAIFYLFELRDQKNNKE